MKGKMILHHKSMSLTQKELDTLSTTAVVSEDIDSVLPKTECSYEYDLNEHDLNDESKKIKILMKKQIPAYIFEWKKQTELIVSASDISKIWPSFIRTNDLDESDLNEMVDYIISINTLINKILLESRYDAYDTFIINPVNRRSYSSIHEVDPEDYLIFAKQVVKMGCLSDLWNCPSFAQKFQKQLEDIEKMLYD
jgi:hypothetical protein